MTSSPNPATEPTEPREAVRITEPSGKTYRIFADGRADGFQRGAVICNYIPSLLVETAIKEADRIFQTSKSPNESDVPSRGGAPDSRALNASNVAAKISTAAGEK